jgi:hypothetical protein
MEPVERKLAEWKSIYDQLQATRARRDAAFDARTSTLDQLEALDAELNRLQGANDAALQALYRAMEADNTRSV